jgi:hypothetical protein
MYNKRIITMGWILKVEIKENVPINAEHSPRYIYIAAMDCDVQQKSSIPG